MNENRAETPHVTGIVSFLKRHWLATSILSFFILILIFLPIGIRYGLKRAFVHNGADNIVIQDVDFNPFIRKLTVYSLKVTEDDTALLHIPELTVKLSLLPLLRKQIYCEKVSLLDSSFTVEQDDNGRWRIGGLTLTYENGRNKGTASQWGLGIGQIEVSSSAVTVRRPDFRAELNIDTLSVSRLKSWAPDQPASLKLTGRLNDGPLGIDAVLHPFSSEPRLQGTVKLSELSLAPFSGLAYNNETTFVEGNLNVISNLTVELQKNSHVVVTHQGIVSLSPLFIKSEPADVSGSNIAWDGRALVSFQWPSEAPHLKAEGKLMASSLAANIFEQGIEVQSDELRWEGQLEYGIGYDPKSVSIQSSLSLQDLTITSPDRGLELLTISRLDINEINTENPTEVRVSGAQAHQLQIGTPKSSEPSQKVDTEPLFVTETANISGIQFSEPATLSIDLVDVQKAGFLLRLDPDGRFHLIEDILVVRPKTTGSNKETAANPLEIQIREVRIGNDSFMRFEDEGVKPPFRSRIMLNNADIRDIMTADPDHQSPFTLKGKIGEYSSVILSGTLQLFAPRLTANLTGKIDDFDLSPLTSYTVKHLGYTLKSGHLTADVAISIAQGELRGTNELILRNLKVSPEDAEKMDNLSAQLKIPLDVALSLLRNKDNTITIKLPIQGDITDPRFELSDIINKALGTALRKATMAYLKFSFQPFGGLITLVQIAGKAARIRLDSILFEPGSDNLTGPSLDYLDVVARLMKQRPAISISLCGKISGSDITALSKQALANQRKALQTVQSTPDTDDKNVRNDQVPAESLPSIPEEMLLIFAKGRALVIKNNLVNAHGIDAKRLFICTPEIDKKESAKPSVDLLI